MAHAKVVQLDSRRPRTFTTAERTLEYIRQQIFVDGRKYVTIAEKTGVSKTTINNIASGKTKWPRHTTLFPLLAALGLRFDIHRRG